MPAFKKHIEVRLINNIRLLIHVEMGLTGLRSILRKLRPKPEKPSDARTRGGHPFTFRLGTQDRAVFRSVNKRNEYRLPESFEAEDVIVDIGTHIGSFCYAALQRGSEHVYGFEAEKSNYECATRNLARFGERVRLRNAAVWRSDKPVEKLTFTPSSDERHTAGGNVWSDSEVEVEAVAFDEVIKEATQEGKRRVRLLKMDCEGSEFPILLTSRMLHLVDEIRGEFHEFGGEHDESSVPESMRIEGHERFTVVELSDALERAGFTVVSLRDAEPNRNMGLFFAARDPEGRVSAARRDEPPLCKVCDLPDWRDEEFQDILRELNLERVAEERKPRKAWEWGWGIRGLRRLGAITPEATAIGVGAGFESPLYYFANHVREVHATDIYGSGDFAQSEGKADMLTHPEKFAPFPYRKENLKVKYMDGLSLEYPDDSFDFAFSFSSIEHFGGHEAASRAMCEISRVLRPGGVAAIATEVILNDRPHGEYFLPDDIHEYLVRPSGLELAGDIDFMTSPTLLKYPVDLDTSFKDASPQLVLKKGRFLFTSVVLILQKPKKENKDALVQKPHGLRDSQRSEGVHEFGGRRCSG